MSGVRPGDVIAGKFRIERLLGEGGMGYVVAARHLQLGQTVALKFMRDEVCTPEYKSRFLREARNTVRLKSKHVSRVLDVGSLEGGTPYMVMEYLEGTDLSARLQRGGPIAVPDACDYVIQACEAIAEAHAQGIVHRDLKLANLFLTSGPSGETVVKVLDFGVSKVLDLDVSDATSPGGRAFGNPDTAVTKATDLLGSPSYMAPEQIESARNADAQSDLWSLGVILFRIVSGKAPFHAPALGELIQQIMLGPIPNLRDLRPEIPAGLESVVARCLERDRAKRFRHVAELAQALAPYGTPVVTPSLERIAILGPALVTAPRTSQPPPMSSGASLRSSGPAWWTSVATPASSMNPPGSGTPPPPEAPFATERDPGIAGGVLIGLLAAVVIGGGVAAVVVAGRSKAPPSVAPAVPVAVSTRASVQPPSPGARTEPSMDPSPAEPPIAEHDPAPAAAPPAAEPSASAVLSATVRRPGGSRPRAATTPRASGRPTAPDEIPATRE